MTKLALIGLIFGFSSILALPTNDELCKPDLCKIWTSDTDFVLAHNIGCDNDGSLGAACPSDAELVNMDEYKDYILHLHNDHRNQIANGNIDQYDTAARMTTMKWSHTLQYMAEFNCKTCNYGHDKCRNTPKYPNAGQNIGETRNWPDPKPSKDIIKKVFNDWFKEHKHSSAVESIGNFTGSNGGSAIGHFTQVVQDHANEVGCGLIKFKGLHKGKLRQIGYFVCNYAMGNIDEQPIYKAGQTASNCQTGTNGDYSGLCSENEEINLKSMDM